MEVTFIMREKTELDKQDSGKREVMCVEQVIIIFTEYGDVMCIALSAMTIAITGITLHKLKKLENGLYQPKEMMETASLEQAPEEGLAAVRPVEPLAEETSAREQEKLLDAVLGEVFP